MIMSNYSNQCTKERSEENDVLFEKSSKKRGFMSRLFMEPDPKPIIQDKEKIKRMYVFFQPAIFTIMYVMYFVSYLGRKCIGIGFAGDSGAASILGLSDNVYSNLTTIYYFTYAVGKFLGGFLADRVNIRVNLPLTITVSSICIAAMSLWGHLYMVGGIGSLDTMVILMYISWGLSGFIQALTFPMCAKALVYWYSNKNRASIWSWWSTSHEFGSACSGLLAGFMLQYFGWEAVFIVPAMIGISVSILGYIIVRDKPVTIGLPEIETYLNSGASGEIQVNNQEEPEDKRTFWQVFVQEVLCNKIVWILSLTYVCVYILRFGTLDWFPKVLMESGKKLSPIMAGIQVSVLSIFGTIGTLTIPYVSEKIFKGRRSPAICSYFVLSTVCLIALRLIFPYGGNAVISMDETTRTIVLYVLLALIGVSVYGPQVMVGGIAAIESASKRVSSTITGITGSFGYVGAILISFIGRYAKVYGYQFLNNIWILSAILGIILMISIWDTKASKDFSH